jgi:CDP-glycerol glycerophosphotransferase (TagB/SpsB family)
MIFKNLVWPIFFVLKHIIPKGPIIVLHTYNRNVFRENTRYLCEYLANKEELSVYWVTDNDVVKSRLRDMGINYISTSNPLKMLWVLLRTKVVVDSGDRYINLFGICDNRKTKRISTLHGCGPKVSFSRGDNIMVAVNQIFHANKFDYVNFPSRYAVDWIGKRVYLLPNYKIISLGYPRCDMYFDQQLVNLRLKAKPITRSFIPRLNKSSQVILYTPTWRPYEYALPLEKMFYEDSEGFNEWLKEKDLYLFYTLHTAALPHEHLSSFDRIIYIDSDSNPLFDINEFLLEVDILINDYSTTSTDFALLDRPQVFYMPDYEYYSSEKGFVENYRALLAGCEVANFNQLIEVVDEIMLDPCAYNARFEQKRQELLAKYYDSSTGDSSEKFYKYISDLI